MKKMKITVVSPEQMQEEGFRNPSKYYFVNALGECVFLHTRDRQEATQYVKDEYGGKYNIRTSSDSKSSSETLGARASINNKSRSGSYTQRVHANQGRGI